MSPLLTTADIAPIFKVTVQTVQHWAESGELIGKRIGKRWYFTQEAVDTFLEVGS